MPTPDPLGDRMKAYEYTTRAVLPRRTYTVIRVDGRAFHSYLRDADKPYDTRFAADMAAAATELCREASGCLIGYTQSDEISLILSDFANPATQPWFGGVVQKMASIAGSIATAVLTERRPSAGRSTRPLFDARVFTLPDRNEVMSYLRWRQADCTRNSISMAGRVYLSARQMHGMSAGAVVTTLAEQHGIDWHSYPAAFRYGTAVVRTLRDSSITLPDRQTGGTRTVTFERSVWEPREAPELNANPGGFLDHLIPNGNKP